MGFESNIHNVAFDKDEHHEKRKVSSKIMSRGFPYTWKRWIGFLSNIKCFFRDISDFFHRGRNGYAPFDSVEAGSNIIHYIIVILTEFRNNTYSYPDHEFDSFEDWVACIDTIIDLLEFSDQDPDDFNKYPWGNMTDGICESWYKENERITKLQKAARTKAFQMLNDYIDALWI